MKTPFAVLLIIVLGMLFPVLLVGSLIRFELLNAPTLKQVLRDANVGQQAPAVFQSVLQESIAKEKERMGDSEQLNNEGEQQSEGDGPADLDIAGTLTPEKTYAVIDPTIETAVRWLTTGESTMNIAPVKQALRPVFLDAMAGQKEQPDLNEIPPFSLADTVTVGDLIGAESGDGVIETSPIAGMQTWLLIGWAVFSALLIAVLLLQREPIFHLFAWLGAIGIVLAVEAAAITIATLFIPDVVSSFFSTDMNGAVRALVVSILTEVSQVVRTTSLYITVGLLIEVVIAFVLSVSLKKKQTR